MMTHRLLALVLLLPLASPAAENNEPFEFLVMGCMPYYMPQDAERFQNVIAAANEISPAFSVHCGDTKYGQAPCDDAAYDVIKARFDQFRHPFIYTPGDNEWTDCHKAGAGHDPIDRLALVRRLFFPGDQSLGTPTLTLTSQSREQPEFATYVENKRWTRGGILFATLHVVGSNNNANEKDSAAMEEFLARDAASIAWLKAAFAEAAKPEYRALALFIQANPLSETGKKGEPRSAGFANFVPALTAAVQTLPKPVYLFHADSHYFRIDKPLTSATGRTLENFTRIETFGGHNLHLIRVVADPNAPEPLIAMPHLIDANRVDPNLPLPPRN